MSIWRSIDGVPEIPERDNYTGAPVEGAPGVLVDVAMFAGGSRFVVGDVLPDDMQVETIEFGMDLDSSWRLTAVLRIGEGGADPIDLRFSVLDGAPEGSHWEMFKTLGVSGARSTIRTGVELLAAVLPTSEAIRLSPRRPGRRARPDGFYAAKAKAWCEALAVHPDRPNQHLVELHPSTTVTRWQGWLKIAEERGLFERPVDGAKSGRALGWMTDRGNEALQGAQRYGGVVAPLRAAARRGRLPDG